MKKLAPLVIAIALLTTSFAASAQNLTEEQARTVVAPWYRLFNQPVDGDMRTLQEQVLTADYESCWGYLPGECWGRDASIKVVGGFAKSIPDMKFDIKEVLVAGDRVIVRGEVSGTPAGDLFVWPIAARASGSWRSIFRPSETARLPGRTTSKTGSVPWGSFAPSKREQTWPPCSRMNLDDFAVGEFEMTFSHEIRATASNILVPFSLNRRTRAGRQYVRTYSLSAQ
jgi:hypothetical protein